MVLPVNAAEKITFKTADKITLHALFTAPKEGNPTVVMLHGLASWKGEWKSLITMLEEKGWGVLSYDARGHGDSSIRRDEQGGPVGYRYFGPPGIGSPWRRMINDVGMAVSYLNEEHKIPRSSMFFMGASLGANVALNYAARSKFQKGVVLLSPGLNYQGIETKRVALVSVDMPVLIIVSERDRYSFQSSKQLKNRHQFMELWTDVKPGHGVQMFDASLLERLFGWLEGQS